MGRSQQRTKPKKRGPARQRQSRPKQGGGAAKEKPRPAADLRQPASPEQLLTLQRQIGNKSTGRLLSARDGQVVQREGAFDQARQALMGDESEQEAEEEKVHEIDSATVQDKWPLAKKLAQGLGRVMSADYPAMIQDEKGLKAIDTTAKVDRYLEAAFKYSERGFHDYIGLENKVLVLTAIREVPGLYEKLGLLLALEPHHARLIDQYLGIPPLKGFDYEIETMTGGGGPSLGEGSPLSVEASATRVEITCKQEGEELYKQVYYLAAVGVTAGLPTPVPATVNKSSGTFKTQVFWGPRDFEGHVQLGSAAAGAQGFGYSFGVATFHGNGSKGSLTIDTSGEINTSGELGIGVFTGYLAILGEVAKSKIPKPKTGYKPKIKVTEDVDAELPVTFAEEAGEPGETAFKQKFVDFLKGALEADRLHVTITGFRTLDKPYNVDLMQERIKNTRKLIEEVVEERGIDPDRVQFSEVETVRDETPPKQFKDPPRDRITKVHLKGTITVKTLEDFDAGG